MSRYYYFAATLPALQFGSPPPFSSEEFLRRAERYLGAADYELLSSSVLFSLSDEEAHPCDSRLLASYRGFERGVRNELARLRAKRLGRQAEEFIRGGQSGDEGQLLRAAQAAFLAPTPLDGELALERERWAFLDSLSPFQTFELDSLLAYRIKLLILERLASFGAEVGEARYRKIYADILETGQARP